MRQRIVVFGRAPAPGRVKTRLAQHVGNEAAAEVYRHLLEHALAEACAAGPPVTLALAEAVPAGDAWRPPPDVAVELQQQGNLGARMLATFSIHFARGAAAVVLVGSDIPGLTAALIMDAFAALERAPVVLGPAVDGGYWLIGQRRPGRDLFTGVPWSSPGVLAATRRRLIELELVHEEIEPLRDLDTIKDVVAVVEDRRVDRWLRERIAEPALGRRRREPGDRRPGSLAGSIRSANRELRGEVRVTNPVHVRPFRGEPTDE